MVQFGKKFNQFMSFGRKVLNSGVNLGRKLLNHSATVSTVAHLGAYGLNHIAKHQGVDVKEHVARLHQLGTFANDVNTVGTHMSPHIANSQSANFV